MRFFVLLSIVLFLVTLTSAVAAPGDVVINEIMYKARIEEWRQNIDPRKAGFFWEDGDDPAGDYVEIHNRGIDTIDLSGWALTGAVEFPFPAGTMLDPNAYLVVCADVTIVRAHYGIANLIGNYEGVLNEAGERVTLVDGSVPPRIIDTVRYNDDPPWPLSPDQEGRSLELIDPNEDNARVENWRASRVDLSPPDDGPPAPGTAWQLVEATDEATSDLLQVYIRGAGEFLIDSVEFHLEGGGPNLLENGSFEEGEAGWTKSGNHSTSFVTSEQAFDGAQSEHLVATGTGGGTTNSLTMTIPGLVAGERYTVRAWVTYLNGADQLVLRLSDGSISTRIVWSTSADPKVGARRPIRGGTPGSQNTVHATDGLPPFVTDIAHEPSRPTSSDDVTITARVTGDAAIDDVTLLYELYNEPYPYRRARETGSLPMARIDSKTYSATIPAERPQTLVRYRVEATDAAGRTWTYPDDAELSPNRAYFSYDGEEETQLPTFFLILSRAAEDKLMEDVFSSETVPATLIIDGIVHDHIETRFRAERAHVKKTHKFHFNKTEYFRGMRTLDLDYDYPVSQKMGSNLFWFLGQDNIATEVIRLNRNGRFYGVFLAQESPNPSWLRRRGKDDAAEIFKAKSSGGRLDGYPGTFNANLTFYAEPSDIYERMYSKRGDSLGSFGTLKELTRELLRLSRSDTPDYMEENFELTNFLYKWTVHVVQPHCDFHSKNYFMYRPPGPEGKWDVAYFDYDRFFGCRFFSPGDPCHPIDENVFCSGTVAHGKIRDNPETLQRFYRILDDVVNNVLTDENVLPLFRKLVFATSRDRNDELTTRGQSTPITRTGDFQFITRHFAQRRDWLSDWVASRAPAPANRAPTIRLSDPVSFEAGPGQPVLVEWEYEDAEGDPAVVDLYWTDFGFSLLQPIATDIPAEEGRYGWVDTGSVDTDGDVYIQAVIRDGQAELPGRHTSTQPVTLFDGDPAPAEATPVIDPLGGDVDGPIELTVTAQAGWTIYVTLDGSDPRLSNTREHYDGPFTIVASAAVRAVAINDADGTLSEIAASDYSFPQQNLGDLRITEIMYHPPTGDREFEFLEFTNVGAGRIDLTGVSIVDGVEFAFVAGTTIDPGENIVLAANAAAFHAIYGNVTVAGEYTGKLSNGGERIEVRDASGTLIIGMDYDDDGFWPIGPDGFGYSLVAPNTAGDPDHAENWRASAAVNGSPGADDPAPAHGGVEVHEILAHAEPPFEAAIELRNLNDIPVDVSGWYLSSKRSDVNALRSFVIPQGTLIPEGGFTVFYDDQFNAHPGQPGSFSLAQNGGAVYLSAAGADGELTGFISGRPFGPAERGISFGRYGTSERPKFPALAAPTFGVENPSTIEEFRAGTGGANTPPLVGTAIVNEIHYHPPDAKEGDEAPVEFIEIRNLTGGFLPLYDEALGRGWLIDGMSNAGGGREYEFPPNTQVPGGGYLLVVPIEPLEFCARFDIPAAVPVVGPYGGGLDNGGERIELLRPADVTGIDVSFVVVDAVRFNDRAPWPLDADGGGPSLERVVAASFGNDASNWEASTEAGGTPGRANSVGAPEGVFRRGDANADDTLNLADAVSVLEFLFLGGDSPTCAKAADTDDSGGLNITDGVFLLKSLFVDPRALPAPVDECGEDPTGDGLSCVAFAPCEK